MSFSNVKANYTMKETESVTSDSEILNPSKGNRSSGTGNPGVSGAKNLMSLDETILLNDRSHAKTDINIKHTAQPGKGGFLSAIKNFFMGLFTNDLKIPKTVKVTVAGKEIKVNGERFRGMLEALPMGEREEAADSLGTQIQQRLSNGEKILHSVIFGNPQLPATTQDVSNMMLFIQLRHEALRPYESFTNGAYSIEDSEGKLADYLDSCKEGYNRSSSHLEGLQNAPLCDGKRNAMRGIDIPGGVTTGLLDKHGTIHYGSIPQQEGVKDSKQRLFIKTERHGCRLSLRSFKFWTKSFWVNTSGRAHRAMQFSDIGKAISNCFEKPDEKFEINYRSGKLPCLSPKDIAETFKNVRLCEELEVLKPYFSKNGKKRLPENARLFTMFQWLDVLTFVVMENQSRENRRLFNQGESMDKRKEKDYEKFFGALQSIKSKLYDIENDKEKELAGNLFSSFLDHPDRVGNEVMMSLSDFQKQDSGNPQPDSAPKESNHSNFNYNSKSVSEGS